ncbi:MAG: type II secretion system protein N [Candidatus Omnitrophota bacterium]
MKKKDFSPEEKLLNLIKNKKPSSSIQPQDNVFEKPMPEISRKNQSKTSDAELLKEPEKKPADTFGSKAEERISGILKSEVFKSKVFEPSRLKLANRYLIIALGVLSLYFVIDLIFVRPYKNVQSIVAGSGSGQSERPISAESKNAVVIKDYSSYSDSVANKSVFGKSQGASEVGDSVSPSDELPNVGLVGIIAGSNPQAIIEDKKSQKTYYLNKGQSFDGYVVEEITNDKVSLDYDGKKITLFL